MTVEKFQGNFLALVFNKTCLKLLDAQNVVHLQFNKYDDFYIAFDTYEIKYNFLKSLRLASELSVTNSWYFNLSLSL